MPHHGVTSHCHINTFKVWKLQWKHLLLVLLMLTTCSRMFLSIINQVSSSNTVEYPLECSCPTLRRLGAKPVMYFTSWGSVTQPSLVLRATIPLPFTMICLSSLQWNLSFCDLSRSLNISFNPNMWFEHPFSTIQIKFAPIPVSLCALNKLLTSFFSATSVAPLSTSFSLNQQFALI